MVPFAVRYVCMSVCISVCLCLRGSSSEGSGGGETPYLGGIDPTLYKTAASCAADEDEEDDDDDGLDQAEGGRGLGSVRFGLAYERETERLTVTVVRARHLPSRNPGTANACDPFVRFVVVARTYRFVTVIFTVGGRRRERADKPNHVFFTVPRVVFL